MNINRKSADFSLGFTTASGSSINVSNKALSKAKEFFINEIADIDNCEDTSEMQKESNETKLQVSNVFQTADERIEASTEPLTKAKMLLQQEVDEFNIESTNLGFQTASGQSIKISNKALSKAEELFKADVDEFNKMGLQTASGQSLKISNEALSQAGESFNKDIDAFKIESTNLGFETASGQSIKISNEALSKAEELFKKDIDEFKIESKNVGFQTASGQNIKISNEALSRAEELFNKGIDEFKMESKNVGFQTASGQNIKISNEAMSRAGELFKKDINEFNTESKDVGFQTAGGQSITISSGALSQAEELFKKDIEEFQGEPAETKMVFHEEISKIPESSRVVTRPVQKRKINDLDDNVSLHRQPKTNQFKKLRFSNEFQVPRLVENNAVDIKSLEKQRHRSLFMCSSTSSCSNDNLNDNIDKSERNMKHIDVVDNSLISHEIAASTVALLADEIDSNSLIQWSSPSDIKESDDAVNVPSSPVIGGQFIAKKRKSTGGRKKKLNNMKNKKYEAVGMDKLKEINDNVAYPDRYINKESKCSVGIQVLKDEAEKCSPSVVNDYGDTQLMLDFINETGTILEKRIQAALEQDKQITLKQRNRPKPTISKLYFHKKSNANNRVSWKTISKGNKPVLCTYKELIERKLPPDILDITSNNATAYKFRCTDFYGQSIVQNNIDGINMEDGARLILDENGYAGIVEITRSFLASPGVDPKLLPDGWVKNHYKWIVWKLASLDRIKLGPVVLSRALTPDRVIMELKYRYDREIDRSQRSAFRKFLEKDDVPSKRMVVCVSSITEHKDSIVASGSPNQLKAPSKKLTVTDGWYSIQASVDQAMMKNIMSGKIKEGTKLLTYGAELLNCDQGYSPLEAPETVRLKLHTNSTRRARWDIKLGYIAPSGPICIKLRTICHNGGLIGKIEVSIARVYPLLYHQKTSTGESIFRNARSEEKANIAYEKECRSMIEAFYAKAEKYFSGEKRKNDSNPDSIDLVANEWNEECQKLSKEKFLSSQELQQLRTDCHTKEENFRKKLESRLQATLPPPRQVTSMLKIRIIEKDTSAILAIWAPSEEVTDTLKEGNCISIINVMPSLRRGGELQLTANRSTIFRKLNVSNLNHPQRTYTALSDINIANFAPAYGEFDTVGIVTCIRNEPFGMKNFEAVYLAYPRADSQSSYLSILFWQGISSHGYAEILTVGSSVACGNLEWRRAASWSIPIAYCTERSIFTRNPRQNHLQQPFADLRHVITDVNAYVDMCTLDISKEIQKKSMTRLSDQYTPDKNNFVESPTNANIKCDRQFNNHELPGSSLATNQPAKSAAIQKRLEKLQYYGEPPSLSPIVLKNSSKRVSLKFQSPLKSRDEKRNKNHTSLEAKYTQNSR